VPRWPIRFAESLSRVERWLLPAECLLCGERVAEPSEPLACALCRSRWRRLPEYQCPRCGQPQSPGIDCRLCVDWPAELVSVNSAVWLDDSARRAVHLLKYDGWWRLADSMAAAMTHLPALQHGTVLVPIPLSASRERSRGYNQSARLAAGLRNRRGKAVRTDLLVRTRDTRTQTQLTPEEREANLRGAFAARAPIGGDVILVDDVFTTGATLAAAARGLIRAGASRVTAVTFARAARPLDGAIGDGK